MTYLSFYRLVKSVKRQIFYRLTEILSFYAFLRPVDLLIPFQKYNDFEFEATNMNGPFLRASLE